MTMFTGQYLTGLNFAAEMTEQAQSLTDAPVKATKIA